MKKELTCIGCPMGCRITAEMEGDSVLRVEGFTCRVGERYAREELTNPRRVVTALCPVAGSRVPLAVKTSRPVDKRLIFDCLAAIVAHTAQPPIRMGDVLIRSVCGTDADVIATQHRPA